MWNSNLQAAIQDLSDLEFQKLAWMGQLPNVVSSFIEVVNMPYDFGFKEYIEYLKSSNSGQLLLKCIELDSMLSSYNSISKTDLEILEDPDWIALTDKAKEVCLLIDDNHVKM